MLSSSCDLGTSHTWHSAGQLAGLQPDSPASPLLAPCECRQKDRQPPLSSRLGLSLSSEDPPNLRASGSIVMGRQWDLLTRSSDLGSDGRCRRDVCVNNLPRIWSHCLPPTPQALCLLRHLHLRLPQQRPVNLSHNREKYPSYVGSELF